MSGKEVLGHEQAKALVAASIAVRRPFDTDCPLSVAAV
jgi:hypothetical protein